MFFYVEDDKNFLLFKEFYSIAETLHRLVVDARGRSGNLLPPPPRGSPRLSGLAEDFSSVRFWVIAFRV